MMLHKKVKIYAGAIALSASALFTSLTQAAETAICYNCPPEWADWGTQLKAIARDTGIQVPQDNKNSGQALAQLVAEQGNPVADVVYYGVSFGIQADSAGVVASYKPAHWDDIPAGMKDSNGKWVALHSGTMGFMVNVDALGGAPVPQSWDDLLKPESDQQNLDKLLQALEQVPDGERQAQFHCVLVYVRHAADPTPLVFHGSWAGEITRAAAGEGGFGYDPIFYVPALGKTAAELSKDEKRAVSHRGKALTLLLEAMRNA